MIPLRRHDRYVLKAFWASFGAVLLFFTVIVVVIYVADRTGRMIRNFPALREAGYEPWMVAAGFYVTLIPFIWLQLVPLAVALAAGFALSRLTRHNELAPLVTAGVSTRRVTLPVILSGAFIALLLFGTQELFFPSLSREHLRLSRLVNDWQPDRVREVPHFADPGGARVSMAAYQPMARRMEGALLTIRGEDGTATELRYYPLVGWDAEADQWTVVEHGTLFPLGKGKTTTVRKPLPAGERVPLEAGVRLFEVSLLKELALGLSSRETAALVEAEPDNPRIVYMHHEQFTRCLTSLVILLLSVPFSLQLGRNTSLPGTGAALAATALQYGATFLVVRLATNGEFNPVVMAWAPTVLGGSIGLALWLSMRS